MSEEVLNDDQPISYESRTELVEDIDNALLHPVLNIGNLVGVTTEGSAVFFQLFWIGETLTVSIGGLKPSRHPKPLVFERFESPEQLRELLVKTLSSVGSGSEPLEVLTLTLNDSHSSYCLSKAFMLDHLHRYIFDPLNIFGTQIEIGFDNQRYRLNMVNDDNRLGIYITKKFRSEDRVGYSFASPATLISLQEISSYVTGILESATASIIALRVSRSFPLSRELPEVVAE